MLTDPTSLTIDGKAVALPRVGVGANHADYSSADGSLTMRVQQSTSNGVVHTSVSLRRNKIAADPLTAINRRLSANVVVRFSAPSDGFSAQELVDVLGGLTTFLTASSGANATKVLGGEK